MLANDPTDTVVLQEFELRSPDTDGTVARIVLTAGEGEDNAIPLLTSIDNDRQVATLHRLNAPEGTATAVAERAALTPLVASWRAPRRYVPRINEHSLSPPSYYRLAVTESGVNNAEPETQAATPILFDRAGTPVALLLIGLPLDSYAGLLVLVGSYRRGQDVATAADWPLPMSDPLGVRIYESRA